MNKIKNKKGITLISLVVTIIILLILAGVTIATLMGDNGLIKRAQDAKIATEIASIKEEIQTDILGKQAENQGNISDGSLKEILKKYGTLSEEEKLTDKTLTTTKGSYEIKVSDILNGTTVKDVPPTFTTVANAPNTSGFNPSNTYYVAWDLTSSPYAIDDTTLISGTAPSNWYDYTAGKNRWANVKTTGGENDCYWVWIPRYAYKVPTKPTTDKPTAETIEVKFLQGKTNKPIGETTEITNTTPTPGTWVVHPAFTSIGNGGFGELEGIWVAKYEASSSSVDTINLENGTLTGDTSSLAETGGGTDTSLQVRVKPNVTSWRELNVNGIFEVCQNLTTRGNSLQGTTNLDSHMMKNTEWGAVAYLSSSKYGKTDSSGNRVRVYNNPYYNDTTNHSPITGLAGKTETQVNNGTTTDLYKYNTTEGTEASTTGNVYGIYDMAGGAWEYVAGYLDEVLTNNSTLRTNSQSLYDADDKYKDKYVGTSDTDTVNYLANQNKYGDAVYETSSSDNSNTGSWDSSGSYFPISSDPVFVRGGRAYHGSYAGVFASSYSKGIAFAYYSFRPVVIKLGL